MAFLEAIEFADSLASGYRLNATDFAEYLEEHLAIIFELRGV